MTKRKIVMGYSGRLGNKLFQYALAYRLQQEGHLVLHETAPAEVGQDEHPFQLVSVLERRFPQPLLSGLLFRVAKRLNKYGLYHAWMRLYGEVVEDKSALDFDPTILDLARKDTRRPLVLRGYWQSPRYFDEVATTIKKAMAFPKKLSATAQDLLDSIEQKRPSVAVHFRRGDYLQLNNGLAMEYYRRAIALVHQQFSQPHFFLFSDDPEFIRGMSSELFGPETEVTVVESKGEPEWSDLFLMSRCRGLIMANSTYSWWAGYLMAKEDSIVWVPREWYVGAPVRDLFLPTWILVPSLKTGD